MMKVFLDTNILLDYGQVRLDYLYAKAFMELGERGDLVFDGTRILTSQPPVFF